MARVRSPNYPSIGLSAAVDRVRKVHADAGQQELDRESFVQTLGYSGLSGPAAKLLSALAKYGLISKVGSGEVMISDLAMDIMFGTPPEKAVAIEKAANSPPLFAEINEKWPERRPTEAMLRNYLARRGFSVKVLDQVIGAYGDTMSLISSESDEYESPPVEATSGSATMHSETHSAAVQSAPGFDIGFVGTAIRMSGEVSSRKEAQRVIDALTALQALLPEDGETDARAEEEGQIAALPKPGGFED